MILSLANQKNRKCKCLRHMRSVYKKKPGKNKTKCKDAPQRHSI